MSAGAPAVPRAAGGGYAGQPAAVECRLRKTAMFPSIRLPLAAFGLALVATSAQAETITFNDLVAGATLSTQYASLGVTFSPNAFSGPGTSGSGEPWATNTHMLIADSNGPDVGGLGTPELVSGMVLRSYSGWLTEDGDASFTVSFSTPITSFSADFGGVTEFADVTIWAYNGGTLLGSVSGTATGQFTLSFSASSITSVAVRPGNYLDYVAVDNITFAPVPEPVTYATMALGLAGLLAWRRRQGR